MGRAARGLRDDDAPDHVQSHRRARPRRVSLQLRDDRRVFVLCMRSGASSSPRCHASPPSGYGSLWALVGLLTLLYTFVPDATYWAMRCGRSSVRWTRLLPFQFASSARCSPCSHCRSALRRAAAAAVPSASASGLRSRLRGGSPVRVETVLAARALLGGYCCGSGSTCTRCTASRSQPSPSRR